MLAGANVTHLTCCFVRKFIRLMQLLNAENLVVPLIWPLSKRDHGLQHGQYHVLQSFSHLPQCLLFQNSSHSLCTFCIVWPSERLVQQQSIREYRSTHCDVGTPLPRNIHCFSFPNHIPSSPVCFAKLKPASSLNMNMWGVCSHSSSTIL